MSATINVLIAKTFRRIDTFPSNVDSTHLMFDYLILTFRASYGAVHAVNGHIAMRVKVFYHLSETTQMIQDIED
jgi:hypothetical protein